MVVSRRSDIRVRETHNIFSITGSHAADKVITERVRFLSKATEITNVLQLNPPLPMNTPKGEGFAHVLIDYGPESDLYWTVIITETGEFWTFSNREVRASKNITLGRVAPGNPPRDHAPRDRESRPEKNASPSTSVAAIKAARDG